MSIDENGQMLMSTYAEVRTSLGLVIGTNVQAYDADLDDLADGSLTGSKVASATDSAVGVVELSTDAESVTGTSDSVVVTPGTLTARLAAPGAIGGTTPGAGTFTTLSAGAAGFATVCPLWAFLSLSALVVFTT